MGTSNQWLQTRVARVIGGAKVDPTTSRAVPNSHHRRQRNTVVQVGRFLWHLLQMVIAMQIGMELFHRVLCATIMPYPILHEAVMDSFMAAPMVVLMKWHGHCWRHSAEMVGGMLVGPAILIVCILLHTDAYLPGLTVRTLPTLASVTMYVGMLAAMLYRRADYA